MAQEVKDAAQESKQALNTAKAKHREHVTQLRLKVKSIKKLTKEAQEKAGKEAAALERGGLQVEAGQRCITGTW